MSQPCFPKAHTNPHRRLSLPPVWAVLPRDERRRSTAVPVHDERAPGRRDGGRQRQRRRRRFGQRRGGRDQPGLRPIVPRALAVPGALLRGCHGRRLSPAPGLWPSPRRRTGHGAAPARAHVLLVPATPAAPRLPAATASRRPARPRPAAPHLSGYDCRPDLGVAARPAGGTLLCRFSSRSCFAETSRPWFRLDTAKPRSACCLT